MDQSLQSKLKFYEDKGISVNDAALEDPEIERYQRSLNTKPNRTNQEKNQAVQFVADSLVTAKDNIREETTLTENALGAVGTAADVAGSGLLEAGAFANNALATGVRKTLGEDSRIAQGFSATGNALSKTSDLFSKGIGLTQSDAYKFNQTIKSSDNRSAEAIDNYKTAIGEMSIAERELNSAGRMFKDILGDSSKTAATVGSVVGSLAGIKGLSAATKPLLGSGRINTGASTGAFVAGAAGNEVAQELEGLSDAELYERSEVFNEYIQQGFSNAEARQRTIQDSSTLGGAAAGGLGAVGGALTKGVTKNPLKLLAPSKKTLVGEVVEEGAQGAGEQLGVNIGKANAVTGVDLAGGIGAAAAEEALGAGLLSGVGGTGRASLGVLTKRKNDRIEKTNQNISTDQNRISETIKAKAESTPVVENTEEAPSRIARTPEEIESSKEVTDPVEQFYLGELEDAPRDYTEDEEGIKTAQAFNTPADKATPETQERKVKAVVDLLNFINYRATDGFKNMVGGSKQALLEKQKNLLEVIPKGGVNEQTIKSAYEQIGLEYDESSKSNSKAILQRLNKGTLLEETAQTLDQQVAFNKANEEERGVSTEFSVLYASNTGSIEASEQDSFNEPEAKRESLSEVMSRFTKRTIASFKASVGSNDLSKKSQKVAEEILIGKKDSTADKADNIQHHVQGTFDSLGKNDVKSAKAKMDSFKGFAVGMVNKALAADSSSRSKLNDRVPFSTTRKKDTQNLEFIDRADKKKGEGFYVDMNNPNSVAQGIQTVQEAKAVMGAYNALVDVVYPEGQREQHYIKEDIQINPALSKKAGKNLSFGIGDHEVFNTNLNASILDSAEARESRDFPVDTYKDRVTGNATVGSRVPQRKEANKQKAAEAVQRREEKAVAERKKEQEQKVSREIDRSNAVIRDLESDLSPVIEVTENVVEGKPRNNIASFIQQMFKFRSPARSFNAESIKAGEKIELDKSRKQLTKITQGIKDLTTLLETSQEVMSRAEITEAQDNLAQLKINRAEYAKRIVDTAARYKSFVEGIPAEGTYGAKSISLLRNRLREVLGSFAENPAILLTDSDSKSRVKDEFARLLAVYAEGFDSENLDNSTKMFKQALANGQGSTFNFVEMTDKGAKRVLEIKSKLGKANPDYSMFDLKNAIQEGISADLKSNKSPQYFTLNDEVQDVAELAFLDFLGSLDDTLARARETDYNDNTGNSDSIGEIKLTQLSSDFGQRIMRMAGVERNSNSSLPYALSHGSFEALGADILNEVFLLSSGEVKNDVIDNIFTSPRKGILKVRTARQNPRVGKGKNSKPRFGVADGYDAAASMNHLNNLYDFLVGDSGANDEFRIGSPYAISSKSDRRKHKEVTPTELGVEQLKNISKIGYVPNGGLTHLFDTLSLPQLYTMFNLDLTEGQENFDVLAKDVLGNRQQLALAYNAHNAIKAKRKSGQRVFWKPSFISVGRIMFEGVNPQNNKWMRELYSPTTSKRGVLKQVDPSDADQMRQLTLSVAQSLEIIDVETKVFSDIAAELERKKVDSSIKPLIDQYKQFHTNGTFLGRSSYKDAIQKFESKHGKLELRQLSAISDIAKMEVTKVVNKSGTTIPPFVPSSYLEADGKSDGIINQIVNFGTVDTTNDGDVDNFLTQLAQGGVYVHGFMGKGAKDIKSFANMSRVLKSEGKIDDLTTRAANRTQTALNRHLANFPLMAQIMEDAGIVEVVKGKRTFTRATTKKFIQPIQYQGTIYATKGKLESLIIEDFMTKLANAYNQNPDEKVTVEKFAKDTLYAGNEDLATQMLTFISPRMRKQTVAKGLKHAVVRDMLPTKKEAENKKIKEGRQLLEDFSQTIDQNIRAVVTPYFREQTGILNGFVKLQEAVVMYKLEEKLKKQYGSVSNAFNNFGSMSPKELRAIEEELNADIPMLQRSNMKIQMTSVNQRITSDTVANLEGAELDQYLKTSEYARSAAVRKTTDKKGKADDFRVTFRKFVEITSVGKSSAVTLGISSGDGETVGNIAMGANSSLAYTPVYDGHNVAPQDADTISEVANNAHSKMMFGDVTTGNPTENLQRVNDLIEFFASQNVEDIPDVPIYMSNREISAFIKMFGSEYINGRDFDGELGTDILLDMYKKNGYLPAGIVTENALDLVENIEDEQFQLNPKVFVEAHIKNFGAMAKNNAVSNMAMKQTISDFGHTNHHMTGASNGVVIEGTKKAQKDVKTLGFKAAFKKHYDANLKLFTEAYNGDGKFPLRKAAEKIVNKRDNAVNATYRSFFTKLESKAASRPVTERLGNSAILSDALKEFKRSSLYSGLESTRKKLVDFMAQGTVDRNAISMVYQPSLKTANNLVTGDVTPEQLARDIALEYAALHDLNEKTGANTIKLIQETVLDGLKNVNARPTDIGMNIRGTYKVKGVLKSYNIAYVGTRGMEEFLHESQHASMKNSIDQVAYALAIPEQYRSATHKNLVNNHTQLMRLMDQFVDKYAKVKRNGGVASQEIEVLDNLYRQLTQEGVPDTTKQLEFLAYGLTNPVVNGFLKRTNVSGTDIAKADKELASSRNETVAAIKKILLQGKSRLSRLLFPSNKQFDLLEADRNTALNSLHEVYRNIIMENNLYEATVGDSLNDRLERLKKKLEGENPSQTLYSRKLDKIEQEAEDTVKPLRKLADEQERNKKIDNVLNRIASGFGLTKDQQLQFKDTYVRLALNKSNKDIESKVSRIYETFIDKIDRETFLRLTRQSEEMGGKQYDLLTEKGVVDTHSFMALMIVAPNLRNSLIESKSFTFEPLVGTSDTGKIDAGFRQLVNRATSYIHNREYRKSDSDSAAMAQLLSYAQEVEADREYYDQFKYTAAGDYLDSSFIRGKEYLLDVIENSTGNVGKFVTDLLRSDFSKSGYSLEVMMQMVSKSNMPQGVKDLFFEVRGMDGTNNKILRLINKANTQVASRRQNWREKLPERFKAMLNESGTYDADDYRNLSFALGRSGLASLSNKYSNIQTPITLLLDEENRAVRKRAVDALIESDNGRAVLGEFAIDNAKDYIARSLNEDYDVSKPIYSLSIPKLGAKRIKTLLKTMTKDELFEIQNTYHEYVTLNYLDSLPESTIESVRKIKQGQEGDLEKLIRLVGAAHEKEKKKHTSSLSNSVGNIDHLFYLPEERVNPNHKIKLAKTSERRVMEQAGYVYIRNAEPHEAGGTTGLAFYETTIPDRESFSQGILQRAKITEFGSGDSVDHNKIFTPSGLRMLPKDIAKRIDVEEDFFQAIGKWHGRLEEEDYAFRINSELVDNLHEMFKGDGSVNGETYVNVAESDNPLIKDAWSIIPKETKDLISRKFGKSNYFPIRADLVTQVLGYRNFSLLDYFKGNDTLPTPVQKAFKEVVGTVFGDNSLKVLNTFDQTIKKGVATAKDMVVIRSVMIPFANIMSNIVHLWATGVPLTEVVKGYYDYTRELNQYREDINKLTTLESKVPSDSPSDREKKEAKEAEIIRTRISNLKVFPLIQRGQFTPIAESMTQYDKELLDGNWQIDLDTVMDRIPKGLRDIGKVAILSKDTELFKFMESSVQYGDFIAKAIRYDYLTETGRMSSQVALDEVEEEFVNFNYLSGRTKAGLESYGLLWFSNFKIRSVKIAARTLTTNPFRSMLQVLGLEQLGLDSGYLGVGTPVTDNALAKVYEGDLSSTGFGMAFAAPTLLPVGQVIEAIKN